MSLYAILLECDPGTTLGGSCTRDILNMDLHIQSKLGGDKNNIFMFVSDINRTIQKKSLKNSSNIQSSSVFLNKLEELSQQLTPNDTMIVLISGHGYGVFDSNGDEVDRQDEMINIVSRSIIDDELYQKISKYKCRLLLFSDTCHSGTMFDLKYVYDGDKKIFINQKDNNDIKTNVGNFVSYSACSDSQLSMCDIGEETGFGGSLTTAILEKDVLNKIYNYEYVVAHNTIKNKLNLLNQKTVLSTN